MSPNVAQHVNPPVHTLGHIHRNSLYGSSGAHSARPALTWEIARRATALVCTTAKRNKRHTMGHSFARTQQQRPRQAPNSNRNAHKGHKSVTHRGHRARAHTHAHDHAKGPAACSRSALMWTVREQQQVAVREAFRGRRRRRRGELHTTSSSSSADPSPPELDEVASPFETTSRRVISKTSAAFGGMIAFPMSP